MSPVAMAIQSVAGTPQFFAIRPFTVTFFLAAQQLWNAQIAGVAPPFLGNPIVVVILLILTAAEWGMGMSIDTREIQQAYSQFVNPVVATAATMGYIDAGSSQVLNELASTSAVILQDASALDTIGRVIQIGASFVVGGFVWFMTVLRVGILNTITELDEDDDLGIQSLLYWSENAFVVVGFVIFVVLPALSILIFLGTLASLFIVRKYLEHREKKSLVACPHCSTMINPSAPTCYQCGTQQPAPRKVGMFGQPIKKTATDLDELRFQLTAHKRCHVCATRLPQKSIHQPCPTCNTTTFTDAEELKTYLNRMHKQLPRTLLISLGLSSIPLIGLIPGIVYYRLSIITSLRAYVPRSVGCMTRWGVRLLNMLLVSFQWVPVLGAAIVPAMCLTNYMIYHQVVNRESQKTFGKSVEMEPAQPAGSRRKAPAKPASPTTRPAAPAQPASTPQPASPHPAAPAQPADSRRAAVLAAMQQRRMAKDADATEQRTTDKTGKPTRPHTDSDAASQTPESG